jgi:multidrug efflux pump subunit AcrB
MTGYKLTPDDIVKAVVENNQISPAGNVRIGNLNMMTPSNTVVSTAEGFLDIPLIMGSGPTVFLRDVATVEDAADVTVGYALINGKRSVYIPVTKTADASTMDVVNSLKKKLPEMQALLPAYVKLNYEFDQSVYVIEAVKSLATEGILGALLTGLMVFLFLRDLRSSLVVICTIPISVLAAVMLLNLFGQTINIMTLSGLALAIGILVDQATVAIENIHQHLELGKPKARAIIDASREVSFPLLLITICILAVFAPAFIMTGVPKGMFMPLSLSVGFAMIASYILSQTFVPVVCNWWLSSGHNIEPEKLQSSEPKGFEKFKIRYLRILDSIMVHSRTSIIVYLVASFGLIAGSFLLIGKDLMPKVEHSRQFQLRLVGPEGLRIERTEEAVIETIGLIQGIVGKGNVDITSAFVGMTPSSYGTNALYIFNSGPQEAILQVNLAEDFKVSSLDELKDEIRKGVKTKLPEIKISFEPIELTDKIMSQGANTPIEVLVASKNIEEAQEFSNRVKSEMSKISFLRDIRVNQPLNYPSLMINIDRIKAAQFGLSTNDVARSLVAATSSSRFTAKNLWLDRQKGFAYQVQVQVPEYEMNSVKDIENIPMVRGQLRPTLTDVATITPTKMPAEYDRIGPRRIVTVSANVFKKDLGSAAASVQRAIKNAGEQPKGMVVEVRGLVKLLEETLSSLQSGLLLAIVVIFLLLAANYQSFKVSFVVLVTVPAVLAGSMILLLITGGTLNLQSYMGIIMSVGVSIANAVLLVTTAENLRMELGDSEKAARQAGSQRIRPILMTSIAMVVGMLPMASGLSESGETAAPLGRAVIGGLVASTFAALLILPVVFGSVQRKSSLKSVSLDPDDKHSEYYDLNIPETH